MLLRSRDVFLDHRGAALLLDATPGAGSARPTVSNRITLSLDLNLSTCGVEVDTEHFYYEGNSFSLAPLGEISRTKRKVFRARGITSGAPVTAWEPVRVYTEYYYQLVPTTEAPTLEIDGIQMHRTSGVQPFASAGAFARAVVRPGARVLDTCGGLGYTAIQALRLGASRVWSFEVSEGVLSLRRLNPWSQLEAGSDRLRLEVEDVFKATLHLQSGAFDAIIHDPPRYALAPDLYGTPFYLRLRDLLGARGVLFHYTGDPNSRRRGSSTVRGVIKRLREAGFSTTPRPDLQGIVATRRKTRTRDCEFLP